MPAVRPVARRLLALAAVLVVVVGLAACEESTVAIRFSPEPGDEFRFTSTVETSLTRTIEGETRSDSTRAVLETVEEVTDVDDDTVEVAVEVTRDGASPRRFEVRLDRASRLRDIDLIEGVPVDSLGLDLGAALPPGLASPPAGALEPGTRWVVAEPVALDGVDEPGTITGEGRIDALGVEDGTDVAIAVVTLTVPVRSVIDAPDGRVILRGTQRAEVRTAYDLGDGAVHRDDTRVVGTVDVIVEPPDDVQARPVRGTIRYEVTTRTARVR